MQIYAIGDKLDELQQVIEWLAQDDSSKYAHAGSGNIVANEGGNPTNNVQGGEHNRQIINPGDLTHIDERKITPEADYPEPAALTRSTPTDLATLLLVTMRGSGMTVQLRFTKSARMSIAVRALAKSVRRLCRA
nr:hypothetical protein CFP56_76158 [Quercus suber]